MSIFYEILKRKLKKNLLPCYILQGQEIILCQFGIKIIMKKADTQGYYKKNCFNPITKLEWEKIFTIISNKNIFIEKIIIIINIPNNEPINNIYKYINILLKIIHRNILLIITYCKKFYLNKEKIFYKNTQFIGELINCTINNHDELIQWLNYNISINYCDIKQSAKELLLYNFKNDFLGLSKTLEILFLIYNKSTIKKTDVSNIINNQGKFNAIQWVHAVLQGNKNESMIILQTFIDKNYEPIILIRTLQRTLTKNIISKNRIKLLLRSSKYNEKNHYLSKYNYQKLICLIYKIITILTNIEINIKTYHITSIWIQLKIISLLFFQYYNT
ncbi:MAG: hypothetical protein ACN793_00720 [Buchnera aphidicola (Eriosoma harunire)]